MDFKVVALILVVVINSIIIVIEHPFPFKWAGKDRKLKLRKGSKNVHLVSYVIAVVQIVIGTIIVFREDKDQKVSNQTVDAISTRAISIDMKFDSVESIINNIQGTLLPLENNLKIVSERIDSTKQLTNLTIARIEEFNNYIDKTVLAEELKLKQNKPFLEVSNIMWGSLREYNCTIEIDLTNYGLRTAENVKIGLFAMYAQTNRPIIDFHTFNTLKFQNSAIDIPSANLGYISQNIVVGLKTPTISIYDYEEIYIALIIEYTDPIYSERERLVKFFNWSGTNARDIYLFTSNDDYVKVVQYYLKSKGVDLNNFILP
jgi:hypothetical protein